MKTIFIGSLALFWLSAHATAAVLQVNETRTVLADGTVVANDGSGNLVPSVAPAGIVGPTSASTFQYAIRERAAAQQAQVDRAGYSFFKFDLSSLSPAPTDPGFSAIFSIDYVGHLNNLNAWNVDLGQVNGAWDISGDNDPTRASSWRMSAIPFLSVSETEVKNMALKSPKWWERSKTSALAISSQRSQSRTGKKLPLLTTRGVKSTAHQESRTRKKSKAGPIMITGIPSHLVEDVVLENIKISYPGHGSQADAKREVAEDISRYPEQYFFGVLPAWGAYIRHAKNIQFKNVTMTLRGPDERQKIVLNDVEDFVEE
ncbi:hypothetical protein N9Z94_03485 [Akkermansiaceae bacterium]|nr:hypothetical protein [Akkermansiaceae bacterium]